MTKISPVLLLENVIALLTASGVESDKAEAMALVLVEADLIGHDTHGVVQLESYLDALASGEMKGSGQLRVVNDRGACVTWDGGKLPGGWLVRKAMELAYDRVKQHGVVTIAIGRAHHIGALAVYLREAAEKGYVAKIKCSTASVARMAPFGGTRAVFTPNPSACGFPTAGDPVMIDISATITTTSMTFALACEGRRYPEPWALTADGEPTDDPRAVTKGGGTLLPLGGRLKGHKGYAMALEVDLLTQGLAGFGRIDKPDPMSLAVFVQVIDPEAFAGLDQMIRQTTYTADRCRQSPPVKGGVAVRVPGDAASRNRRAALKDGLDIPDGLLDRLQARAVAAGTSWRIEAASSAGGGFAAAALK